MKQLIKRIHRIIANKVEITKYLILYYRDDLLLISMISTAAYIALIAN